MEQQRVSFRSVSISRHHVSLNTSISRDPIQMYSAKMFIDFERTWALSSQRKILSKQIL